MTEKLTWAEFVEKYQPEDGDKFLDDRGQELVYSKASNTFFYGPVAIIPGVDFIGQFITCPLIPPKKGRKMWPAIVRYSVSGIWAISGDLYSSEQAAKDFEGEDFHSWPAIPGPDGSYEVSE